MFAILWKFAPEQPLLWLPPIATPLAARSQVGEEKSHLLTRFKLLKKLSPLWEPSKKHYIQLFWPTYHEPWVPLISLVYFMCMELDYNTEIFYECFISSLQPGFKLPLSAFLCCMENRIFFPSLGREDKVIPNWAVPVGASKKTCRDASW